MSDDQSEAPQPAGPPPYIPPSADAPVAPPPPPPAPTAPAAAPPTPPPPAPPAPPAPVAGDEPTQIQAPVPAPPAWPAAGPDATTSMPIANPPTAGQPIATEPPAPAGWGAATPPPGAPTYSAPAYGAPAYGAPPAPPSFGAAPLGAAAPLPEPTKKKGRTGLVIGLIVILVLVAGGIAVAVLALAGGGSDYTLTVDRCDIAADGSLSAAGTVTGDDDDVDLQVDFTEVGSGDIVDSATSKVVLSGGSGSWTASGTAGDSVNQVSCEATVDD